MFNLLLIKWNFLLKKRVYCFFGPDCYSFTKNIVIIAFAPTMTFFSYYIHHSLLAYCP